MPEPEKTVIPPTPGQAEGVDEGEDQSSSESLPGHPPDQAEGDLETAEDDEQKQDNGNS